MVSSIKTSNTETVIGMGKIITNSMTLEEKLKAISQAVEAL